MNDHALSSDFLDGLQRETFDYFVHEVNPLNGLIADKTQADHRRASLLLGLLSPPIPSAWSADSCPVRTQLRGV